IAAVDRDLVAADASRSKIWLTTADAPRLIPFVAVAPAALIEKSEQALVAWTRVTLLGASRLASEPPSAARQIAELPGAPDPLALLRRSGEIVPATLNDNSMFLLQAKSPLSVSDLFSRTWSLWRGAGLIATPLPEGSN